MTGIMGHKGRSAQVARNMRGQSALGGGHEGADYLAPNDNEQVRHRREQRLWIPSRGDWAH